MGLVIVGAGLAAQRLLIALDKVGYPAPVTLVSEEGIPCYNRVLLPELVSGSCDEQQLLDKRHYDQLDLTILTDVAVISGDVANKILALSSGETLHYDHLVLATGSSAFLPQVAGIDLKNVGQLRNLNDAEWLLGLCRKGRQVVVVGGGLLGLEAAVALNTQGCKVTVLHRNQYLMNRQLDDEASRRLESHLQKIGVRVITGENLKALQGNGSVESVLLENGEVVDAEAVLFAVGTLSRIELAEAMGLRCSSSGIEIDEYLQTSRDDVFSLGECAVWNGFRSGLVVEVSQQADCLVKTLMGEKTKFVITPSSTRLKIADYELFAAGTLPEQGREDLTIETQEVYRRLAFDAGRLVGAVFLGDVTGASAVSTSVGSVVEKSNRLSLAFAGQA